MTPETSNDPVGAFIAAKLDVDELLTALTAASANHFGYDPDHLNWGHVGTLNHIAALLREVPLGIVAASPTRA